MSIARRIVTSRTTHLAMLLLAVTLPGQGEAAGTAHRPAARDVTFISTSDCHYREADRKDNHNDLNRATVEAINGIAGVKWPEKLGGDRIARPRGVVVLGDVIDDGDRKRGGRCLSEEQYTLFLADFGLDGTDGLLKYPVFEGWGNHDGPPQGKEKCGFSFQGHLKERNRLRKRKGLISNVSDNGLHYSWDWDDVHFVQLNLYPADKQREGVRYSPVWHDPQGALSFLRKDLATKVGASGRPVVLMSHCGFDTDWWTPADWKDLYETARPYHVVLYLYGHSGTGLRDWAPEGEAKKWACVNDGQTENGFFVIQIRDNRLRLAYRSKDGIRRTKAADGTIRHEWDGAWTWRWTLDREIPDLPSTSPVHDSQGFRRVQSPVSKASTVGTAALVLASVQLGGQGPARAAQAAVPQWDAKCIAVEVPDEVLTDQVFVGRITVKNTGSAPWRSIPFAGEPNPQPVLYSQDPNRNKTWGTDFAYVGQGKEIGPGKEFTFVSGFKAPSAPGEYSFQWRLARQVKDGKTIFFGEPTLRKMIRVRRRPEAPRPVPPARGPRRKKVLGLDDFQYLGSFRLPERVGESGAGYSEVGIALRKMPDGTRRLLMNYTHPRQTLFEAEIPPLARFAGTDPKPLHVAKVKKVWGSLALKVPKVDELDCINPNGSLLWDEDSKTLYWTFYHGYWTGGRFPVLAASRLGDDGKITSVGQWGLPRSVKKWKSYWGGVTKLPAEFARRYTGGRTMALGFGGYYSICADCSRGPALAAIARPDPSRDELDVAELLCYPLMDPIE